MMKICNETDDCQIYLMSSFGVIIHSIEKKAYSGHLKEEYKIMPSVKRNKV